jgi:electron-transferring-flavoprotein dehydrogenase
MSSDQTPREVMSYDVLVVGAGPAGLSCAIKLKQLAQEQKREISVCVIEKGSEVGAHLLSGAAIEPRALNELFPNWRQLGAPLDVPVTHDSFVFLTKQFAFPLPLAPTMHNHGNFIVSLGRLGKWLAVQAEALGVEIYPGFGGAEILYDEKGSVAGVATGDVGIGKDGKPTDRFARGVELRAKQTVLAEGCRGSLTKMLMEKFKLNATCDPQAYGIGIKEIWEIDPAKHRAGHIQHTIGYPVDTRTYGGSFVYHWEHNLLMIGYIVGLDYENTYLSPFEEFQRFKLHPKIRKLLEGGKRISYGSRAICEGGLQSIPRLTFPGGLLVGDTAGFMNVPKIKGTHTAMKSGMIAAEALSDALATGATEVTGYPVLLKHSWLWAELRAGAQHPPVVPLRALGRHDVQRVRRHDPARPRAVDAPQSCRSSGVETGEGLRQNQLCQARRRHQFRPPVLDIPEQRSSRRKPAGALEASRLEGRERREHSNLRFSRVALLPRRRL